MGWDHSRPGIRFATRPFERIRGRRAGLRGRRAERGTPTRDPDAGPRRAGLSAPAAGPDARARSTRLAPPLQVQAEPPFHLGIQELAQDPVDRVPVGGPDDEAQRLLSARPARAVVLLGEARLGVVTHADREDRAGDDRVGTLIVEMGHLVEIVERLDLGRPEADLLAHLAQRGHRNPLARLQAAGDALPESGEDAAGRAPDEEELRLARERDTEDPALHQVGAVGTHGRSASGVVSVADVRAGADGRAGAANDATNN